MTGSSTAAGPDANAPGPVGVRVLVVDDEPSITDAVATALRYEGFETRTAGDGPRRPRAPSTTSGPT